MIIGYINYMGDKTISAIKKPSKTFEDFILGKKNNFTGYIRILILIKE